MEIAIVKGNRPSSVRRRGFLLAVIVLIAAAAWLATPAVPDLDDAYIPLHSADSILAGQDAQFGTSPLVGITSPPYLLLLTGLRAAGCSELIAIRVASAMGLTALVIALWILGRSARLDGWQQALLTVLVLAAGAVVEQAVNGVETGWAMAVAIALIGACLSGRPLAAAVAAGLLPWLRPDLAPLAGLMFLLAIWKEGWSRRLRAAAVALLVFMPWPIWIHLETGGWFPNTMAAKTTFYATACEPVSSKTLMVALAMVAWLITTFPASVVAACSVWRHRVGLVALIATQVTLAAYLVLFPVGLFHNNQRYVFPIGIPLIALGLALSMRSTKPWIRIVVPVVTLAVSLALLPGRLWASQGPERVAAAEWVKNHIEPHARLMVQDAGVFSIFTTNPLIDFVGLKTPSSAAVHQRVTWASCGNDRPKAIAEIARSSRADYLIITTDWDSAFSIAVGLATEGLQLREVRSPPQGEYGYRIFQIGQS